MKKINWESVIKTKKVLKKQVKDLMIISEYLKDMPDEGYFKDNKKFNIVEIKECKSSTLRRYVKLLDSFLKLVNTNDDREILINKKLELEKELLTRDDGLLDSERM